MKTYNNNMEHKGEIYNTAGKGMDYIGLALYAFGGLGIEVLYAYLLEPMLYGAPMQEWSTAQVIMHWVVTCLTWGMIAAVLVKRSGTRYGYPLTQKGQNMTVLRVMLCLLFVVAAVCTDYMVWDGFKPYLEYVRQGALLFVFQYIYYAFETMLFLLIIVFGQKACEAWFGKENFPYGGIICGLTWGVAHIFTKDILTGVLGLLLGVALGSVYMVVNRDLRKAYVVMFLMFVL